MSDSAFRGYLLTLKEDSPSWNNFCRLLGTAPVNDSTLQLTKVLVGIGEPAPIPDSTPVPNQTPSPDDLKRATIIIQQECKTH
jgi:hypothetical protein